MTPVFNSWSLLIRHIMIQLHVARSNLYKLSDTVIICEMTGLNLGTYNASNTSFDPQQTIINRGMMRINEYIADMNRQADVFSPYFSGLTHRIKGGNNLHHRYQQTTHDGLHFNEDTAIRMAESLLQNVRDLHLDNAPQK